MLSTFNYECHSWSHRHGLIIARGSVPYFSTFVQTFSKGFVFHLATIQFVFFIFEDGIMFCKNDWGNEDSEEPGKRFTLQKIEECFNGENVPRLKGKLF